MAYLPPDQLKRQQTAVGPQMATSGVPSAPSSSAPSVAPAAPSVNTGSGWTNLQDYLTANQPALQAEKQKATGLAAPATQATTSQWDRPNLLNPVNFYNEGEGGKLVPKADAFNDTKSSAPAFTEEQKKQAADVAGKIGAFSQDQKVGGIDQWLRGASGVADAWNSVGSKYGDALKAVQGYQWSKPPAPEWPTPPPPEPATYDQPTTTAPNGEQTPFDPKFNPYSGLPSSGANPDAPIGVNLPTGGPPSVGVPGGMFSFPDTPAPGTPQAPSVDYYPPSDTPAVPAPTTPPPPLGYVGFDPEANAAGGYTPPPAASGGFGPPAQPPAAPTTPTAAVPAPVSPYTPYKPPGEGATPANGGDPQPYRAPAPDKTKTRNGTTLRNWLGAL